MDVIDEFFGKLSFVEASKHEASYFFGAKTFNPANYIVEYQIYNNGKIVSEAQRKLGIEIERKYRELEIEIEKFINSQLEKIDAKSHNYNLEKDLEIRLITIPQDLNSSFEWSIEYAVKKDFSFFEVEFQNWEPTWFSISA